MIDRPGPIIPDQDPTGPRDPRRGGSEYLGANSAAGYYPVIDYDSAMDQESCPLQTYGDIKAHRYRLCWARVATCGHLVIIGLSQYNYSVAAR